MILINCSSLARPNGPYLFTSAKFHFDFYTMTLFEKLIGLAGADPHVMSFGPKSNLYCLYLLRRRLSPRHAFLGALFDT